MFVNARPATAHRDAWKPKALPGGGFQLKPSAWKDLTPEDDYNDYKIFLAARELFRQRLILYGYIKNHSGS